MRKPKSKDKGPQSAAPNPAVFSVRKQPENLRREISTRNQKRFDEDTLIYGENDALPLLIAKAVDESPAATSCIDTVAQFIKGSGFSDPELMKLIVDKDGTTLWDLHCGLADSCALFWGFAVNLQYNEKQKITNAYQMSFESLRFKKQTEKDPYIRAFVFNPYFGTDEYNKEFSTEYPAYDLKALPKQLKFESVEQKQAYKGQVYYYGKTSPLHRFYPVPKYWSARQAIEADHLLQTFNKEELENGFFQSVLMNVIGDPNQWSKNPRFQEEYEKEDGTKGKRSTKTVGEEFNEVMAEKFSGAKKAGTAFVSWALNENQAVKISSFPVGINSDRLTGTQDSITKIITIATKVPSILANISEGVSLGSGGSEIQKAIELMQSRTSEWRQRLMNFYNEILLPNLEKGPKERVEIVNFNPVSVKVEFDKQFWEALSTEEKRTFIKNNFPSVELIETATPPAVDPETGEAIPPVEGEQVTVDTPAPAQTNGALKDLKIADINKIQKIVARYNLWKVDPNNGKALTYDQAKQMLVSFGFTEEELNAWLVTPEEI